MTNSHLVPVGSASCTSLCTGDARFGEDANWHYRSEPALLPVKTAFDRMLMQHLPESSPPRFAENDERQRLACELQILQE